MNNSRVKILFRPNKELGQNFLFNKQYLKKIADSCLITPSSAVFEIGPGYGSLTEVLALNSPRKIVCVEKDAKLYELLEAKFENNSKIKVFNEDALKVDWNSLIEELEVGSEIIITGNLPYYIANQLIAILIERKVLFDRVAFLVQKEVAQRWAATPYFNKSKYSYLSIFIRYYCEVEFLFDIPKHFFNPCPEVDGGFVRIQRKKDLVYWELEEKFLSFVKNCFRFRRKTLFNNIKSFWGDEVLIRAIFKKFDFDLNFRPQDLDLEHYLMLFKEFYKENIKCKV